MGRREARGLACPIAGSNKQNHGGGLAHAVETCNLRGARLRAEVFRHDRLMPEIQDRLPDCLPFCLHAGDERAYENLHGLLSRRQTPMSIALTDATAWAVLAARLQALFGYCLRRVVNSD
jgi:hypothetical protein